ncbi:uncharacterized protein LOC141769077 isoform X1 [Sebastes fasciatus]|uniref:uncharacterized protein LOC141769077 isoform X1 n=1 Tax=Sebastes fasciatus TaxID=394691 RepID=UPI003D9F0A50
MKMKSKLLYIPMVMAVMSALVVTATTFTDSTTTKKPTTTTTAQTTTPRTTTITTTARTTTGPPGLNLSGKMFTLSVNGGGIAFYPPYFSPTPPPTPNPTRHYTTRPYYTTTRPYTSRPYYTTTRPYTTRPSTTRPYYTTTRPYTSRPYYTTTRPYTTRPYYTTTRPYTTRPYYTTTRPYYTTTPTAPPTRGVSVCLRYLADSVYSLFTLSPSSRNPLNLAVSNVGAYTLNVGGYSQYMKPNVRFWSNVGPDIWTRVCLTMDSVKNVAQVFSGSNISVRKMLPIRYAWSGEPVIDFSGFDGQVTDIQIWDYPLRYREVFNYMTSGVYGQYSGSVLSWSHISYSPRGNILLEDTYEWQARQPINSIRGRKGRRVKGGMKIMEFFNVEESQREQL